MPIILSEAAANQIKKIITDQGMPAEKTSLRVGVRGGGCSGFSYSLDLVEDEPAESDEQFESHGVKILCDMKSHIYLSGDSGDTHIDFKDDQMMGSGFVFKNPNATSTCGCGSSFSA